MYSNRFKLLGFIALVIVFAVTMTACDMGDDEVADEEGAPGEFIVTVDTSEMEDSGEASGQDIGTQSVAEERFKDYELEVVIVEKGDKFEEGKIKGHDHKHVDYGEEAVLSIDHLEPGDYEAKAIYSGRLKDEFHGAVAEDEHHEIIADSKEKKVTISDPETTTADLTLNLLKGYVEVHIDKEFPEDAPEELKINGEEVTIDDIDEDHDWIIVAPGDEFFVNPWLNDLEFTWIDDDDNKHTRSFEFVGIPNFTKIVEIIYAEGKINFNVSYDFPAEKPEIETLSVDDNDNFVLEWDHAWDDLEDDDDRAFRILRTELLEETGYREEYSKIATVEAPDKTNGKFEFTDDSDEIAEGSPYQYAVAAVEQDEDRTSDIAESEVGIIGSYFAVEIDHEATRESLEGGIKQGEEFEIVYEVKNVGNEKDTQDIWLTMHAPIHPEYDWDHIFDIELKESLNLESGELKESIVGTFEYPGPADEETNIHVETEDHIGHMHLDEDEVDESIDSDDRTLTVNSSFDDEDEPEDKPEFTLHVDGDDKIEGDKTIEESIGIASYLELKLVDYPEDYHFEGWFVDGDIIDENKEIKRYMPTEELEFTAEFEEIEE